MKTMQTNTKGAVRNLPDDVPELEHDDAGDILPIVHDMTDDSSAFFALRMGE